MANPDAAHSDVEWTVLAHDLFDRETPPHEEATGRGLVSGLALLWKKFLAEGIGDDGKPSFTDFDLRWGERTMGETAGVDVWELHQQGRDDLRVGVARLRRWANPALLHDVAGAHARLIVSMRRSDRPLTGLEESIRLLKLAAKSADAAAFKLGLSKL